MKTCPAPRSVALAAVAAITSAAWAAPIPAPAPAPASGVELGTTALPRISEYQLQSIVVPQLVTKAPGMPAELPETAQVGVVLGNQAVQLRLAKHSMRSPTFQVIAQIAGGELVNVPPPPVTTFRGDVAGFAGSTATASIVDGQLTAQVYLGDGGSSYTVQPASDFPEAGLPAGSHVSFRTADVAPHDATCGVVDGPVPVEAPAEAGGGADGSGFNTVEIACDADVPFFSDNGLSLSATVADIEGVLNAVEFVYERDVQITYEVTVIVVRTDGVTDPYTSATDADTLLCLFRNEWNSSPFNLAKRDVGQLFTGKQLAGSTIGLAWNGVICNEVAGSTCGGFQNLAYNIVESTFSPVFDERVSLSAHELGHNWNAPHCDAQGVNCNIMCSSVGNCGGTTGPNLKFATASINSINAFENSRSCLSSQPDTATVPFSDEFPSAVLDASKWTWINLASIQGTASNPPSPPNAMRFFSFGSSMFRDAELRSNFIDLDGQSNLIVTYLTQHTGVESGESIICEYWAGDLVWRELATIVSDGVDQTNFVSQQHDLDLAAEAYHDEFRLRFRVEGDDTGDVWFVDDVYVGPLQVGACCAGELCLIFPETTCLAGGGVFMGNGSTCTPSPCAPPACPEDLSNNGQVDFADILAVIGAWGPCGVCDEDLDGSGDVGFSDILQIIGVWGPCP